MTFAVEQAVENVGGDPADYRRGMAAFHVFDLKVSTLVFSGVGTSTRAFAMHEQLGRGERPSSTWPNRPTRTSKTTSPGCVSARSRSTAPGRPRLWSIDGQTIYAARGAAIPERVQIGFGIWTMLPIRDGRSQSLAGQGMERTLARVPRARSEVDIA